MAASTASWGWHELQSAWAEQLVAEAQVRRGDLVLDIGAGRGAVTASLVAAGARVVAVELHPSRAHDLRARFGSEVVVVQEDASRLLLPRRPFSVVASLPYSSTSGILRRLLHPGSRLTSAHVIVQAQAAMRWSSPSAPAASRWQRTFEPSPGRIVPRHAFRPRPRVDSRVLHLRRCR